MKRISTVFLILAMLISLALPCFSFEASAAVIENYETTRDFEGLKLSIIGDSISTYEGVTNSSTYNPLYLSTSEATFGTYYGDSSRSDYSEFSQVTRADTWWQQTIDTLGMELLVNNAWSGSYVLKDTARGNTTEYGAAAYKARSVNLHNGSEKPDIIAVYLGTNDVANYSSTDVGSKADVDTASERSALYTSVNSYSTPTTSVEAYYIMLSRMIASYPDAEIYCMVPTICLSTMASGRVTALDNFNTGVEYLVDHFAGQGKKVYLVDLNNDAGLLDNETVKDHYYANNVHPDVAGMDWITTCLISEIMEHSTKGTGASTFHEVTYELDGAFAVAGLPRRATAGQPLTVDFLPYESYEDIQVTVTMKDAATGQAVEIPGGGDSGHAAYIPSVSGPVTISVTTSKNDDFHWIANEEGFQSTTGKGITYNRTTLVSGTYTGGTDTGVFADIQYSLDRPVVLEYDKPWEMEFKGGGGTFAGGIMLMNYTADSATSGNMYIHITQSNVLFGYRDSVGYNNSGISWATIASTMGSSAGAGYRNETHVYRFVNVPNGTSNKIYLYVDGVQIGTMDMVKMIGSSATHASASSVDISGKDFTFAYLGSSAHPIRNCSLSYIKVWENGVPEDTGEVTENYRWELSADQDEFVSVEDDYYTENQLRQQAGSISGGTFTGTWFDIDKQVVLMHDQEWNVEWASEGTWVDTRNGAMLLCTTDSHNDLNAYYLYRRNNSELIALGEWKDGVHNNYGVSLSANGIDGTAYHKYKLSNEVTTSSDGSYVSNMVYLYVDDVKIAPMESYFSGGTDTGTTSDWVNGRDFVFSNVGTQTFTVGNCDLDYLEVTVSCKHEYDGVVTAPTCTADGYTTYICGLCGESYTDDQIAAAGHSWDEATCTAPKTCVTCGVTEGAALGHSYSAVTTAPTCTADGYTTYTCSACGDSYTDDTVTATGHDWTEAICTAPKTCVICGVTEGSALGHCYSSVVTAPDCTAGGYTTYTCSACGHSYVGDEVAALGHSWAEATCTAPRSCTVCGLTDGAMAEHQYEAVVTAPTCTDSGHTTYTCSSCGDSYISDAVSATGHSYESVTVAPTCTNAGYTVYTCSVCGHSYNDAIVSATGHSWIDATCTEAKHCATCGQTSGSATGHSYVSDSCTACGGLDPDYVAAPGITMSYPTLSFEDEIYYNVYCTVDDMTNVVELGLITFSSRLADGTVADAVETIPGYITSGSNYIVRSSGIPAKELGDALYFKVYARLSDGSYAYSDVAGYNAIVYANTILNSAETSDAAKSLVVAMLNYGAAAQTYFGYNTDSLMNAGLTAEQQAMVAAYDETMVDDVAKADSGKTGLFVNNGGWSSIYPSVSFEGAFAINYYFATKYTPDTAPTFYWWDAEAYANAEELTAENASGTISMVQDDDYWYGMVAGIAAKQIDQTFYTAGSYTVDGTTYYSPVISYSLGSYCETIAAQNNAFGAATAVYGYYAKAYFAS